MPTIRSAESTDYPSFARMFPELAVDEPVPPEDRFRASFLPGTLIAEQHGRAVGYAYTEVLGELCYIRNLVTAPEARRSGVAAALMREVLMRAHAASCTRWCLNVKPDNEPAVRLYEKLGFLPQYEGETLRVTWSAIDERAPHGSAAFELAPDDELAFEEALGVERGLLGSRRKKGALILATGTSSAPAAIVCFDQQFPGGYPFKARAAAEAGSLLRAMHARRAAIIDCGSWRELGVQIFVQDAPMLRDLLLSLGAAPVLRILHMAAPLPPV
jgi:GNAT superfamily N-acetyltransferase